MGCMKVNKKRFVTVLDINEKQHYCIICKDTIEAFKVAQKYHQIGEHHYRQIRFRSTFPPKKLGYILKDIKEILLDIS